MIIAFIGDIGAGKTTCREILEGWLKAEHYSFAAPLKQIAEIFGFAKSELYGTQEEKMQVNKFWGVSGRVFLEKLGTDIFREHLGRVLPTMTKDYSIWIKLFQKHIEEYGRDRNFIIDDCRFVEEADFIKKNGGYIIKIVNNNNAKAQSSHISAVEYKKIKPDFVIDNSYQDDNHENIKRQLSDVVTAILMGFGDFGATTYLR